MSQSTMPCISKFKPRNIPCPVPKCNRYLTTWSGANNHLRTHPEKMQVLQAQGWPQWHTSPMPNDFNPDFDYDKDAEHDGMQPDAPPQQKVLMHEKIHIHPLINGHPCDQTGAFLPDSAPPPTWTDPSPADYAPYTSKESFQLTDLLF